MDGESLETRIISFTIDSTGQRLMSDSQDDEEFLVSGKKGTYVYNTRDVLGSGGHSTVYMGEDVRTGEIVALKRAPILVSNVGPGIRTEEYFAFQRERTLGPLLERRYNLLPLKESMVVQHDNEIYGYQVMDCIEWSGSEDDECDEEDSVSVMTLENYIDMQYRASEKIPLSFANWVMSALCDETSYLHRNEIIHGDIKTKNI